MYAVLRTWCASGMHVRIREKIDKNFFFFTSQIKTMKQATFLSITRKLEQLNTYYDNFPKRSFMTSLRVSKCSMKFPGSLFIEITSKKLIIEFLRKSMESIGIKEGCLYGQTSSPQGCRNVKRLQVQELRHFLRAVGNRYFLGVGLPARACWLYRERSAHPQRGEILEDDTTGRPSVRWPSLYFDERKVKSRCVPSHIRSALLLSMFLAKEQE